MIKTLTAVALLVVVLLAGGSAHASEKADLFPGIDNLHRYGFFAVTLGGDVAVEQIVTVLWDTPGTTILVTVVDPSDETTPIKAFSIGNDRMARIEVGLLEGSYEIWLVGVSAPTHYHMNVTYNSDELLFRRDTEQPFSAARQAEDLRVEALLAPYLDRIARAVNQ